MLKGSKPREKGQEHITHLIKAKRETRLTMFGWPGLWSMWILTSKILPSFYCVLKRKSRFWTRKGERSKQHLAQYDALIAKTFVLKPSALQQNMPPAIQHVSQSRLCPGFAAERGTKQVIPNQPPLRTRTDARSGMPNKKLNSVPGLCSLHPALPQEEGQMVPVTQKNAKGSHLTAITYVPALWQSVIQANGIFQGHKCELDAGRKTWQSALTDYLSFCNLGKDHSILQIHLCSSVWEGRALGYNA